MGGGIQVRVDRGRAEHSRSGRTGRRFRVRGGRGGGFEFGADMGRAERSHSVVLGGVQRFSVRGLLIWGYGRGSRAVGRIGVSGCAGHGWGGFACGWDRCGRGFAWRA